MRRRQYLGSLAGISAVSALGAQSVTAESLASTTAAAATGPVGTIVDQPGDDVGPGSYTYPNNLEKGQFDVTKIDVEATDTHWEFTAHLTVQKNQFGSDSEDDPGFSTQVIQLYLHDPNAPDDAPSSAESRPGAVSTFQEEYHYRVHIQSGSSVIETPDQDPTADEYEPLVADIPASGDTENNTISFSIPKETFDSDTLAEMKGAIMVFSQDGFGTAGIRQGFGTEAADWSFGGVIDEEGAAENAPRALDLVGPETVINQSDALSYSADSPPSIPLYDMGHLLAGGTIDDPEGDDVGPGPYTYPNNLEKGQFDVTGVDLGFTESDWEFTAHMGVQKNQFGSDSEDDPGFSAQVIQLYIRDPNAPDDAPTSAEGRPGVVSTFQEGYHYRVHIEAGSSVIETPDQDPTGDEYEALVEDIPASGSTEDNTISFSLPQDTFDSDRLGDLKMTMLVFSQDGFGTAGIRQGFGTSAGDWSFGGVIDEEGATENAPRVVDLVGPEAVVAQSESLSYSADSPASIPLFNVTSLVTGEASIGLEAIAAPGPELFGTMEGKLDGTNSSDPEGQELTFSWTQTGGPEAEMSGTDSAEPTFTAPDVDEETTLEFELTVTNEDGAEATDTTTATVIPQSENGAPVANAGDDKEANPGQTISLMAVDSEDPDGHSLSYTWEQTEGPEVTLNGADTLGPAFEAPEVDEETTLTFKLTVDDNHGKTATDTVNVTVRSAGGGGGDSGGGFGPGFGVVSGIVGIAGGAIYGAKSMLDSEDDEE